MSPARPGRTTAGPRGGRAARAVGHDTTVPNGAGPRLQRYPCCSRVPALRARIPHAVERGAARPARSEEHTSELQSRQYLVCRLLLEKKKQNNSISIILI